MQLAIRASSGHSWEYGLIANHAGLRDGGWTFAITNDWQDAESYRTYDLDAEHNVHRQAIGAVCEQLARVQFEL